MARLDQEGWNWMRCPYKTPAGLYSIHARDRVRCTPPGGKLRRYVRDGPLGNFRYLLQSPFRERIADLLQGRPLSLQAGTARVQAISHGVFVVADDVSSDPFRDFSVLQ